MSGRGRVTGAALNKLLASVKGKPEEYLIKTATLRSMAKAIYTTKNIGHFGLAFEFYTHFTSPIRRYPDLVIHRLIKSHAGGEPVSAKEMEEFESLARHCSEREVGAAEAGLFQVGQEVLGRVGVDPGADLGAEGGFFGRVVEVHGLMSSLTPRSSGAGGR